MLWIELEKEDKINLIHIREDIWENIELRVSSDNQEKYHSILFNMLP